MGKAHRGKNLKAETIKGGRATCPLCKRTGVKVLYEQEANEKKFTICKSCRSALSKGKMQEALAAIS